MTNRYPFIRSSDHVRIERRRAAISTTKSNSLSRLPGGWHLHEAKTALRLTPQSTFDWYLDPAWFWAIGERC